MTSLDDDPYIHYPVQDSEDEILVLKPNSKWKVGDKVLVFDTGWEDWPHIVIPA